VLAFALAAEIIILLVLPISYYLLLAPKPEINLMEEFPLTNDQINASTSVAKLSTSHKRSLLLYAVPIAALTLVVVILAFWFFMWRIAPISTPPVLIDENITVINEGVSSISGFNSAFANVPQGTNLQFIVNFSSLSDEPMLIQIENLRMTYYNSSVDITR
jgi:hypothetical protein